MRELCLADLEPNYLGLLVPSTSGTLWLNHADPVPRGARLEGTFLPLNPKRADDLRILDGYFQSRPKGERGYYDPKVVSQFLQVNKGLPLLPIQGWCPWPLHPGWIPVVSKMDPGHSLYGPFYDSQVILVFPTSN
jgi:hypothetical protein